MTHIPTITPSILRLLTSSLAPNEESGAGKLYLDEDNRLHFLNADGGDIVANQVYGGNGNDGDLTVSTAITLERESHFRRLTFVAGGSLDTNGFILRAQVLDLSAADENAIHDNGRPGGDAIADAGGIVPDIARRYLTRQLGRSRNPGVGGNGTAANGVTGGVVPVAGPSFGGRGWGGNGGHGGHGTVGLRANAGAGTTTYYLVPMCDQPSNQQSGIASATTHTPAANVTIPSGGAGGAGAGGGGAGTANGGGGGGGGEGGGVMVLDVGTIITSLSTPANVISVRGGRGGHGADRSAFDGTGGGGGGNGGGGGALRLRCAVRKGPTVFTGLNASSGPGGDGGNGGAGGGDGGRGGISGADGQIYATIAGVATRVGGTDGFNNSVAPSVSTGSAGGPSVLAIADLTGLPPEPPSGSILLWRAETLPLTVAENVVLWSNEGSLGWDATPPGTPPTFDIVAGVKGVRFPEAENRVLFTGIRTDQLVPHLTGLWIFHPTGSTPDAQYLSDTGLAISSLKRLGFARQVSTPRSFAYRGNILGNTPIPALDQWHYAVVHFNAGASEVNVNGGKSTGSVGSHNTIDRYYLGAFDTTLTNNFPGLLNAVGFWVGDRRIEVEAYARNVLGLPA